MTSIRRARSSSTSGRSSTHRWIVRVMSAKAPSRMNSSSAREQQVDGDPRIDGRDLVGQAPQRRRRPDDTALGQRQQAAQLLAADPLDQIVGVGMLGDDPVGTVEEQPGIGRHPGIELGAGRQAQAPGPSRRIRRQPAGELPRPRGDAPERRAGASLRPPRPARRRPPHRDRARRGPGATPGSATPGEASATTTGERHAGRGGGRRGRRPSATTGGGTTGAGRRS